MFLKYQVIILFFLFLFLNVLYSIKVTRVKILRSEEEKVRFLNRSNFMKENLFFGVRPILYIQKYACDCSDGSGVNVPPAIEQNFQPVPPAFPDDDQDVPDDNGQSAILYQTRKPTTSTSTASPAVEREQSHHKSSPEHNLDNEDEEEFELLVSNNQEEAHIVDEGYKLGDGFPNDPFSRPFLLTIRANHRNRPQGNKMRSSNRARRRRIPVAANQRRVSNSFPIHGSNFEQQSSSFIPLSAFYVPPGGQLQNFPPGGQGHLQNFPPGGQGHLQSYPPGGPQQQISSFPPQSQQGAFIGQHQNLNPGSSSVIGSQRLRHEQMLQQQQEQQMHHQQGSNVHLNPRQDHVNIGGGGRINRG